MDAVSLRKNIFRLRPPSRRRGFSLIEVMAVMLIIITILALAVPALPGIIQSSRLRNAANGLIDYLTLSRQTAMSRNCRVEVRFYQVPQADGSLAYSSFRSFTIASDGTATALGKVRELNKPIVISELPDQNTLFRDAPYKGTERLPQLGDTAYFKFSFLPGGKTDLDAGKIWFLSLYEKTARINASSQFPDNYAVMQIDDYTGHIRLYRP